MSIGLSVDESDERMKSKLPREKREGKKKGREAEGKRKKKGIGRSREEEEGKEKGSRRGGRVLEPGKWGGYYDSYKSKL